MRVCPSAGSAHQAQYHLHASSGTKCFSAKRVANFLKAPLNCEGLNAYGSVITPDGEHTTITFLPSFLTFASTLAPCSVMGAPMGVWLRSRATFGLPRKLFGAQRVSPV